MTPPTLRFLGAAGTVTGSMHELAAGERRVLLDCGLFQGLKALRLRNWGDRLDDPARIDGVILSHAHLDHSGYLPLLARRGFRGPIYCTGATADLLEPVLRDSAHLQVEGAERANRKGYSKHHPAEPLYTPEDSERALGLVQRRGFGKPFTVPGVGAVTLRDAGHILGSATVEVRLDGPPPSRLVFSGDLGRYDHPMLHDPEPVPAADVLLLESTYGDRAHEGDPEAQLADVVRETAKQGGMVLIPAFAVDRTQELLWMLTRLEAAGKIPVLPIYCDSPMGNSVTEIYKRHADECEPGTVEGLSPENLHVARTPEESKRINAVRGPGIIISSSGMAVGGRILHHLSQRVGDVRNTVLLVGYQAAGTRGRALQDGVATIRMFGGDIPVRAHVAQISGLSAHADREETLRWLRGFTTTPRQVYLVHGEPQAAEGLAQAIRAKFNWNVRVAADGETVSLG